jgi:uncharacterized protein (TIGR00106 family)
MLVIGEFKMIISQLSIAPLGEGISVSKYVKKVIKTLEEENLIFKTNAMATVIETSDLDTLFNAVKKAHNTVLEAGAKRVITELKIDERRDKNATSESKLKALE